MTQNVCAVKDCDQPATHRAELVIYAAVIRLHPPAIGAIRLCVCQTHADEEHARALLTPEAQRQIAAGFAGIGRAKPDWSRSFVRWVRLISTEERL